MGGNSKKFTLVVVRHGEATHNLPDFKSDDLVLTNDPEMPFLNNPLTEKGLEQAGKLAERLKREKFNLVLASDLTRAWDTAQAIVKENPSVDNVQELRELRERNAGVFNGLLDLQLTSEDLSLPIEHASVPLSQQPTLLDIVNERVLLHNGLCSVPGPG